MTGHSNSPRTDRRGFTLLEMMVNLGIISMLLVGVAATATWSSDTVSKTTGRLAAMEKSVTLRNILAADLARILPDDTSSLACDASEDSWSLLLSLPRRDGGYEKVRYRWSRTEGTVTRQSDSPSQPTAELIATGITRLETDWLDDLADIDSPGHSPRESWADARAPGFLHLKLETTRATGHGPDAAATPGKKAISRSTALLAIAAGSSTTP